MTLQQMRYFMKAAQYEHIGRAAKSFPISASAVSAAITALEDELSTVLFERKDKTIRLNSKGRELQQHIQEILLSIDTLQSDMTKDTKAFRGRVRIGASHFLASRMLAPAWLQLQNQHPKLVGELLSMGTASLIGDILGGRVDCGVVFSQLRHPELQEERLFEGQLLLSAHRKHPLFSKPKGKRLAEISKYPATIHKPYERVDSCEHHPMFDRFHIRPRISFYWDSDDIVLQSLKKSPYWTLLPDVVVEGSSGEVGVIARPAGWHAPYHISLVYRVERKGEALMQTVKEHLARQIG